MIARKTWLRSRSELRRSSWMKRGTKPLPKVGKAKARRQAEYRRFLASAAWKRIRKQKLAESPACEFAFARICLRTEQLTVDHKTYARFGGQERMEDLRTACRPCHNHHHALQGKRIGR